MVRLNLILHCDVTVADIDAFNIISSPNVASLRGKTVRKWLTATTTDYVAVTRMIKYLNRKVTIVADFMFVNGIPLLVSILTYIKFMMVEYLP